MKNIFFSSKILFLAIFFLLCLKSNSSQASTLIFKPSQIQKLISTTSNFHNRIKVYRDRSISEIIQSEKVESSFSTILEANSHIYNQKTGIELLALPEVLPISANKRQSTKLIAELSNSLSRINWSKSTFDNYSSRKQTTVLLLPQADNGNIYRDIYDFEISLLDDNYLEKSGATNKNKTTINKPKVAAKVDNSTLGASQVSKYDLNYSNQFNFANQVTTGAADFQSPLNTKNTTQNNLTQVVNNFSEPLDTNIQQPSTLPGNIDIAKYQIDLQPHTGNRLNIPRTKEQQELDKKLAEQQKKLEKQRQELRRKLERERQERAKKRKEEAKKLRQERQEKLRRARQQQKQKQKQLQQNLRRK